MKCRVCETEIGDKWYCDNCKTVQNGFILLFAKLTNKETFETHYICFVEKRKKYLTKKKYFKYISRYYEPNYTIEEINSEEPCGGCVYLRGLKKKTK